MDVNKLIDFLKKEGEAEKTTEAKPDEVETKATEIAGNLADSIASKIAEKLAASFSKKEEVSAETKAKVAEVQKANGVSVRNLSSIDVNEYESVIYKSAKTGKEHTMKKSQAVLTTQWFNALLHGNKEKAFALKGEIESKYPAKGGLEPLNETTAGDGGNLLPTAFASTILDIKDDIAVLRPRTNAIDLSGVPGRSWSAPYTATQPKVYWTAEQAQKSSTSVTFGKTTFTMNTVAAIIAITEQLNEEAPYNMLQMISREFGKAFAREEDRVLIQGTGTTQPTGLNSYTPVATINAGGNLSYANINNAYYAMPQGYRQGSVWVANANRIALMRGISDTSNRPLWLDGLTTNANPRFLGIEVLENNNMPNTTIYLVNLSYYWTPFKHGIRIKVSDTAYVHDVSMFETDEIAVRAEERFDGQLMDTRALVSITNP